MLGVLFYSCQQASEDEYGLLVISVPGGNVSRAAISSEFAGTLSYHINCRGPGNVIRIVRPGSSASIPLLAGYWNVTVTVLNAADEGIGSSEEATVYVERGKIVSLQLPITIDPSRKEITYFAFTSPVFAIAEIGQYVEPVNNSYRIAISVPFGTVITDMGYSMVHTGKKVENLNYPEFSTSRGHFNMLQRFVVTAENDDTSDAYNVNTALEIPEHPENTWPVSTTEDMGIWEDFGFLRGMINPGTSVVHAEVENPALGYRSMAIRFDSTTLNFTSFIAQINSHVPGDIEVTEEDSFIKIRYQGAYGIEYDLILAQYELNYQYYLIIKSDLITPEVSWPIDNVWDYYGLPGLDQPKGTTVISFKDNRNAEDAALEVYLTGADDALYEDLRDQFIAIAGKSPVDWGFAEIITVAGPPKIEIIFSMSTEGLIWITINRTTNP